MRRAARWAARVVLGALALALVAFVVVVIALHTAWGRAQIRARAEAALAASFPGSRVGSVESAGLGTAVVHDLVIAGADGRPVLQVGRAELEVELLPLVVKHVHVERAVLEDVTIVPRPLAPAPPDTSPGPPSWSVDVDDLEVRRARLVTADGATELAAVSVDAAVAIPAGGAIRASLRAAGVWRERAFSLSVFARRTSDTTEVPFAAMVLGGADPVRLAVSGVRARDRGDGEGAIVVRVPAAAARELAHVDLPGDLAAQLVARPGGAVELNAAMAGVTVHGLLAIDRTSATPGVAARPGTAGTFDAAARHVRGVIAADAPELERLAGPAAAGHVTAVAALDGDASHVRGMISVRALRDGHRGLALVALDATRAGAWTLADVSSDLPAAHVTAAATVKRTGDQLDLVRGTLDGEATRLAATLADGTRAVVRRIALYATGTGRLWPQLELHGLARTQATGATGRGYGISELAVRLADVRVRPTGATALVHVAVAGASRGRAPLGSGELDARVRVAPSGAGDRPGCAGARRNAERCGGSIDIDLERHTIETAAAGVWTGAGGHLAIRPSAITLADLQTGHAGGQVAAGARLDRTTGDLSASLVASRVELAAVAPGLAGIAGGRARITRRGTRWDVTASVAGHGVVVAPGRPAVDTAATIALHGRRLVLGATVDGPETGHVRVAAELDGPGEVTDVRGWLHLRRRALRSLALELGDVHLAALAPGLTGMLAGSADLTATGGTGELHLRELDTGIGLAAADLGLAARDGGGVRVTLGARLPGVAEAGGTVDLAVPATPLDPAAWRALGRRALAGATLQTRPIAFDPELFARLGVRAPVHGTLEARLDVAEGAAAITAHVAAHGVQGGPLALPIDASLDATSDATDTRLAGALATGNRPLVALDLHVPRTIDQLRLADLRPPARGQLPLSGTVGLPSLAAPQPALAARDLLAVFGRADIVSGTLSGTVAVGGSVGTPTAVATLGARDLAIRASVEGRAPARLADLTLTGRWDGDAGTVELLAHEPGGALLHVSGRGPPRRPRELAATFEAAHFDLAPLAAFAPGALGAARGVLDGSLGLDGFDPDTGKLHGTLNVHEMRLPLHDLIGTLRKGELSVTVAGQTVTAKLGGKLGHGDVTASAKIALAGSTPKTADLALGLRQITLIRAHEPIIDADVTAHLAYARRWTGTIAIDHAHVLVPSSGGQELLDAVAPADMTFVDAAPPKASPLLHRPPPSRPWLVADVTLAPTPIDVRQDEYQVSGTIFADRLRVSVGQEAIGVTGTVTAQRGAIELFGQRSQLDHGKATFDGTLDPLLDVRAVRDLDDLTVRADVSGRASKPEVTFSSDTGSYSQGDLLAFFVGGQPGASRGEVGQAAAVAGAGYASKLITKRLDKLLPARLKFDFSYEAASATNSQAIGLRWWLNSDTFVEARQHVQPRPDENVNEGSIEYHLLGDWLLQATIGDGGYDNGEIERRWHW